MLGANAFSRWSTMPRTSSSFPTVTLKPGEERRLRRGHCWAYANEIDRAPGGILTGDTVVLASSRGQTLGAALWNPASLIRARLFARRPVGFAEHIDGALSRALSLREQLYGAPHYRLVYGESDGLPGLTVDRYGPLLVAQLTSAVSEAHAPALVAALAALPGVRGLVLRRDGAVRRKEKLPREEPESVGEIPELAWAEEGGLRFQLDPLGGLKGGWFWDQRDNRAWLRSVARGRRVLDLFCHSGGFALQAAAGGAAQVLGLDRSEPALALARASADANHLRDRCRFQALELMRTGKGGPGWPHGEWDLVVLDPPALAKDRDEAEAALGAYEHLNRRAAGRVAPGGVLLSCSCTYPVEPRVWRGRVLRAVAKAGRQARIVYRGGQGSDHPELPGMPETRYLEVLGLQLD
jgi:23S rRNA (cytosine1962-C5)-methyltransferase